jgi:hypothetical protein
MMPDHGPSMPTTPEVAPGATLRSEGHEKRIAALATVRQCELCGEERKQGSLLAATPGRRMWVCDDCQKMLLLRVDDKGTPGD